MTLLRNLFGIDGGGTQRQVLTDTAGRLSQIHGRPASVAVNLNSAASQAVLPMNGLSFFSFFMRGTFTGVTATMEQSIDSNHGTDGNWFPVVVGRSDAVSSGQSTIILTAASSTTSVWNGYAPGASFVRVRSSAWTSGAVTGFLVASTASTTPWLPTVNVTGSGNFSVQPTIPTTHTYVSAATTNATSTVAAGATMTELTCFNPTAAVIYLKFYNKASAPTVGTDVPVVTIPVPVNGVVAIPFGANGKRFNAGLAWAMTAGPLATDTAVVAAGAQLHLTRF